jgi:hypothetical protein
MNFGASAPVTQYREQTAMKRSFDEARLRQAMAEALESLNQVRRLGEGRSGSPAPGDLYVLRLETQLPVEWLVVRAHPEHRDQMFVVPVDDAPLAGTPDVPLPRELVHRPLTARCGQGAWVPAAILPKRCRVSALPPEALHLVRDGVARLARGEFVKDPQREQADDNPNYADWMGLVEKARLELEDSAARVKPGDPGNLLSPPRPAPWDLGKEIWVRLQAQMAEPSCGVEASARIDRPIRAGDLALAKSDFGIEGDSEVRVEFDIRAGANAAPALKVWLNAPPEAMGRYTSVVVMLPGLAVPLQAPLCRTVATLPLEPPTIDVLRSPEAGLIRVSLLDRSGSPHSVQLEAKQP